MNGLPMSKETIKAGNTMMIENILSMPAPAFEDNKAVYRVVEIRGRKSGQFRRVPLAVFQHKGQRYLIAPSSNRDWVHNLISAGECLFVTKTGQERYQTLLTFDDAAIAAVKAYMAQLPDWALQQFPFSKTASDDEMRSNSEHFALFRLVS